jgi:hypothetical protein
VGAWLLQFVFPHLFERTLLRLHRPFSVDFSLSSQRNLEI